MNFVICMFYKTIYCYFNYELDNFRIFHFFFSMYSITLDVGTVMHKDDLNDRKDMYEQAAAFLLNFRLLNRNRMSRDGNLDRSTRDSRNNMIYYSKRFPNVYMTSSFCNEIMNIVNVHLNYYGKFPAP